MGKHLRGKLSCFEWKIAIHRKTFTVAFQLIYNANRQSHDLQEKIRG